jgi:hypothetical protein
LKSEAVSGEQQLVCVIYKNLEQGLGLPRPRKATAKLVPY